MSKSGVKKTVKISNLQSIVLNDNYPLIAPWCGRGQYRCCASSLMLVWCVLARKDNELYQLQNGVFICCRVAKTVMSSEL